MSNETSLRNPHHLEKLIEILDICPSLVLPQPRAHWSCELAKWSSAHCQVPSTSWTGSWGSQFSMVGAWARFRTDLTTRNISSFSTSSGSCQNFFIASSFEDCIFFWKRFPPQIPVCFRLTASFQTACPALLAGQTCYLGRGVWCHWGSKQAK